MVNHGYIPEIQSLVGAFIVSCVSGVISIFRRVLRGQQASLLWVISEFLTAILCGYLMFTAFPGLHAAGLIPDWFTLPIAVAFAAHTGGRVFQEVEEQFIEKYRKVLPDTPK